MESKKLHAKEIDSQTHPQAVINRLLVIDDDAAICTSLTDIGESLGFDTKHVSDPTSVRQYVQEWRPTVIITDLQMPNLDGVALLRTLAATNSEAKIVIVSGMGQKIVELAKDSAVGRGLNVVGAFSKPFSLIELSRTLNNCKIAGPLTGVDVSRGLANDEFETFFQPKCSLTSGQVVGVEALARWRHPTDGLIKPDRFLHLVDEAGFGDPFLDHILRSSIRGVRVLGRDDFTLAVNITPDNLANLSLPDRVLNICEELSWRPEQLTLELTETTSMDPSLDILDVLMRLRIHNFKLSIDDFGTGFSSLLRLRQLPFNEIKIDQRFVSNMLASHDSAVIVETILGMAENLALRPVAEGIESAEILAALIAIGCPEGQGYHFSKPLSIAQLLEWQRERHDYFPNSLTSLSIH